MKTLFAFIGTLWNGVVALANLIIHIPQYLYFAINLLTSYFPNFITDCLGLALLVCIVIWIFKE